MQFHQIDAEANFKKFENNNNKKKAEHPEPILPKKSGFITHKTHLGKVFHKSGLLITFRFWIVACKQSAIEGLGSKGLKSVSEGSSQVGSNPSAKFSFLFRIIVNILILLLLFLLKM